MKNHERNTTEGVGDEKNSQLVTLRAHSKRGFTLLIAVLVSGVLLGLGFAIFNIVSKEVILSSAGKESQFAFYSADTGVECALYWDLKQEAFVRWSQVDTISCGGTNLNFDVRSYDAVSHTFTSQFSFFLNGGTSGQCATVVVYKTDSPTTTRIDSLGYNTCDSSNPRRLERGVRATY